MITVDIKVKSTIEKIWDCWVNPAHITKWNFASSEWHCPYATNNLIPNGDFTWRMEAKDGSMAFDFKGVYQEIEKHRRITYLLEDGRMVEVSFEADEDFVLLSESFEPEGTNADEMQRQGWQAILVNFKLYVENL